METTTRKSEIEKAVLEMLAIDGLPVSFVENEGFKRLLRKLEPSYSLPDAKHFSSETIASGLNRITIKVNKMLTEADAVTLSLANTKLKSQAHISCLLLTAHCLKDFQRNSVVVSVEFVMGPRSPAPIATKVLNDFKSFNFCLATYNDISHLHYIDENTDVPNLSCFKEKYENFITSKIFPGHGALPENRAFQSIRQMVRMLSLNHEKNDKLIELLKKMDISSEDLKKFDKSRINCMSKILHSLVENNEEFLNLCKDLNVHCDVGKSDWERMKELITFLKIYDKAMLRLTDPIATASIIIPEIKYLSNCIEIASSRLAKFSETFQKSKEHFDSFFEGYLKNKVLISATFLDPRFKNSLFRDINDFEKNIKEQIFFEANADIIQKETGTAEEKKSEPDSFPAFDDYLTQQSSEEKEIRRSSVEISTEKDWLSKDIVDNEVDQYLKEEVIPSESNIYKWWKEKCETFPTLGKLVKKYLSCPPCVFRGKKDLFLQDRKIYFPDEMNYHKNVTVDNCSLTLIGSNLDLLNFEY